ncbi:MAG: hypothetical protein ACRDOK_04205 [Streptosporangiaceae bacterium]
MLYYGNQQVASTQAAGRFDRRGDPRHAALARAALGQALLSAGRPGDAVAVLESLRDDGEYALTSRRRDAAVARLTPMIGRCQAAGPADQAAQLTDLRGRLAA